jgi:hypothetical protein
MSPSGAVCGTIVVTVFGGGCESKYFAVSKTGN